MNELLISSLKRANGDVFLYASGWHDSLLVDILEVLVPCCVSDSNCCMKEKWT